VSLSTDSVALRYWRNDVVVAHREALDASLGDAYGVEERVDVVDATPVPASARGRNDRAWIFTYPTALHLRLFEADPSAVLQKMAQDAKLPLDASAAQGVAPVPDSRRPNDRPEQGVDWGSS